MRKKKPSKVEILQSYLASIPTKEKGKHFINSQVFFRGPAGYWVVLAGQEVKNPFDEEAAEYLGFNFESAMSTLRYYGFTTNYD